MSTEHDTFWQETAYGAVVRASRLVSLLLLLQTRGQLTAAELARELEVSERTIHRDVEALSASGVPIYAERGAHGGIRLVDGYRTRLTGMTPEEAEALFLAGLPGPAAELGLGTVVAAAQLKVLASLPVELRTRASRLVERFHLDAGGMVPGQPAGPPPRARCPMRSGTGRGCAIDYDAARTPSRPYPRPARPRAQGRHLVRRGRRSTARSRTYRVSRVVAVEPLDGRSSDPPGFDLAAYWTESTAAYERDAPQDRRLVRVRPGPPRTASASGRQRGGPDAAESLTDPDPEGWLRLRLRMDWPDEVATRMLGAGRWVEVLEPPEVRAGVASTARASSSATPPIPLSDPSSSPAASVRRRSSTRRARVGSLCSAWLRSMQYRRGRYQEHRGCLRRIASTISISCV